MLSFLQPFDISTHYTSLLTWLPKCMHNFSNVVTYGLSLSYFYFVSLDISILLEMPIITIFFFFNFLFIPSCISFIEIYLSLISMFVINDALILFMKLYCQIPGFSYFLIQEVL